MSLELNKLYVGDNIEIMKNMESKSVSTIITSPPYYKQRNYNDKGGGNENTEEEYIDWLLNVFKECYRVVKDNGSIVFNLGDKYINGSLCLLPYKFAISVLNNFNVYLINNITWDKNNPTPKQDKKKLVPSTEPFFIFTKNKNYTFNKDEYQIEKEVKQHNQNKTDSKIGCKYYELIKNSELNDLEKTNARKELDKVIEEVRNGNIKSFRMKIRGIHALPYGGQKGGRLNQINNNGFTIIKIYGNPIKKDIIKCPVETIKGCKHPAIYPLYICEELIKLLSNEGDIILDPFCGSGTTCVASKKLKRNYIGIDINEEYIEIANDRINKIEQEDKNEI